MTLVKFLNRRPYFDFESVLQLSTVVYCWW